ncbi:MAG: flagellar basal body P-ring formation chaperone FlgA [Bdellovibrionales bacterium]
MKIYFILLLTFFVAQVFAEQRLEVPSEINVKTGKLTIGDIAKLEGFTSESNDLINSLVIGKSLQAGELRRFSEKAITDVLRSKLSKIKKIERQKNRNFKLTLKVPKIVSVYVPASLWSKKSLEKEIKGSNARFCSVCKFKIKSLILPSIQNEKIQSWRLELPSKLVKGNFQIPLKVLEFNASKERTYWVSGTIGVMRKLPIARRNIRSGERLTENDIEWKLRDLNFFRSDIPKKSEITQAKVKNDVFSGSVVWLSNIQKEQALKRGDVVDVIIKNSSWRMKLKAVAQRNGVIGDVVPVKNRSSDKVLMGKVVDVRTVELQ